MRKHWFKLNIMVMFMNILQDTQEESPAKYLKFLQKSLLIITRNGPVTYFCA